MQLREAYELLKETANQWLSDRSWRMGAALAYYAAFAVAPLAVVAVVVAGKLLGRSAAEGELYRQLRNTVGPTFARALEDMVRIVNQHGSGTWAAVVSVVAIVIGAMGLFHELQGDLNTIWGVQAKPGRRIWGIVKSRLLSFVMVLIVSALLIVSLISTAAVETVGEQVHLGGLTYGRLAYRLLHWTLSFFVDHADVRLDLQGVAGRENRLEGSLGGRGPYGAAVSLRQLPDRPVPDPDRRGDGVWGRRLAGRYSRVGLLGSADPAVWG